MLRREVDFVPQSPDPKRKKQQIAGLGVGKPRGPSSMREDSVGEEKTGVIGLGIVSDVVVESVDLPTKMSKPAGERTSSNPFVAPTPQQRDSSSPTPVALSSSPPRHSRPPRSRSPSKGASGSSPFAPSSDTPPPSVPSLPHRRHHSRSPSKGNDVDSPTPVPRSPTKKTSPFPLALPSSPTKSRRASPAYTPTSPTKVTSGAGTSSRTAKAGSMTRTTAEKKEMLGAWLGNVDALVEGVQKAGVWGLA